MEVRAGSGFDGFGVIRVTDCDCAGERRWMWMIGEVVCEGMVGPLNSKIDTAVGDNDVPTLEEVRYHARNRRETLRVDDQGLSTEEVCYIALKVHVNMCK